MREAWNPIQAINRHTDPSRGDIPGIIKDLVQTAQEHLSATFKVQDLTEAGLKPMAITRLKKRGLLINTDWGHYRLSQRAVKVAQRVSETEKLCQDLVANLRDFF
jgi:hypothetical protein